MTDDEKAALADVYERAAEYLEEYGWVQHTAGEFGTPRCFVGATASAVGEKRTRGYTRVVDASLWHRAKEFAEEVLELSSIMEWNDDDDRTADEVVNTLHALANKLR